MKALVIIMAILMVFTTACSKPTSELEPESSDSVYEPVVEESVSAAELPEESLEESSGLEEIVENTEAKPTNTVGEVGPDGILNLKESSMTISTTVYNIDSSRINENPTTDVIFDGPEFKITFHGIHSGPDDLGVRRIWYAMVDVEAKFTNEFIIAGLADTKVNGRLGRNYVHPGEGFSTTAEIINGEVVRYHITSDVVRESLDVRNIEFSFDIYKSGKIYCIGTRSYDFIWNTLGASAEDTYRGRLGLEERIVALEADAYLVRADGYAISFGKNMQEVARILTPEETVDHRIQVPANTTQEIKCTTGPFVYVVRNSTRFTEAASSLPVVGIHVLEEPKIKEFNIIGDVYFGDPKSEIEQVYGVPHSEKEGSTGTIILEYKFEGRNIRFIMLNDRLIKLELEAAENPGGKRKLPEEPGEQPSEESKK